MVVQYPHIIRFTAKNQVTLATVSYEGKGRLEESGNALVGLNTQGHTIKAIFYMPPPASATLIKIGQKVDIYDGETLLMSDTVKNFVKGQLNARIWL